MTNLEQIQDLIKKAETPHTGKYRADRADGDALHFIKAAVTVLLRMELERATPHTEAEPIHMEANP